MTVRFTRTALKQIAEALSYIAERSPQGAASVSQSLTELLELAAMQPAMGSLTSRPGVRRLALVPYPYMIFYRRAGKDIVVLRFRHTSRQP